MLKILVVDDDKRIVRMLIRRLKKAGYEIHVAEDGQSGVERALALKPDLILMDIHMPRLNGYEATKQLRQQSYDGLIVALTASAMVDDAQKSIKAGCDFYISKPIDSTFEAKIKAVLTRPNLE